MSRSVLNLFILLFKLNIKNSIVYSEEPYRIPILRKDKILEYAARMQRINGVKNGQWEDR